MESFIWNLISLKNLKGSRTQMTILVGAVLNMLVGFGILQMSAADLQKLNEALVVIGGYFFVDKVQAVQEALKGEVKK